MKAFAFEIRSAHYITEDGGAPYGRVGAGTVCAGRKWTIKTTKTSKTEVHKPSDI